MRSYLRNEEYRRVRYVSRAENNRELKRPGCAKMLSGKENTQGNDLYLGPRVALRTLYAIGPRRIYVRVKKNEGEE